MHKQMVTIVLVTLALAVLVGWTPADSPAPANPCQDACYQAKSTAYQKCRAIPPADRETRSRCFRDADGALRQCLAGC